MKKCLTADVAITLTDQTDSSAKNGAGLNMDGLGIEEQKGLMKNNMYFEEYCSSYYMKEGFEQHINGEWKLGDNWYPCTILDDESEMGEDFCMIVTRNQTLMSERKDKVRLIGGK